MNKLINPVPLAVFITAFFVFLILYSYENKPHEVLASRSPGANIVWEEVEFPLLSKRSYVGELEQVRSNGDLKRLTCVAIVGDGVAIDCE